MNLIKNYYNKEIFQILLISFIIFFLKWFFSYWNFGFENIYTKIIFNPSGDSSYYPFVKQFADLNFSEGYSSIFQQLNFVGFPYLVSIFHAILYKIFGLYNFIILEFICIFSFIIIFFYLFKEFKFSKKNSILFALLFFSIPQILFLLNDFSIPYVFNLKQLYSSFYSLRFPRPLVTNLFLFAFLLFILKFYISKNFREEKIYFLSSGILVGLQFNSFFYFSIISFVLLNIVYLIKYKNSLFNKDIRNLYLLFLSLFIVICLPFLIQLYFIEPDYLSRVGSFELNTEKKVFLAKHLLIGLLKIEFIILIFLNLVLYFLNSRKKNFSSKNLDIFLLFFLISIITPFAYLYIFDTVTFFGNFIFIIALSGFVFLKMNFLVFIQNYSFIKKIKTQNYILIVLIFILINFSYFDKTHNVKVLSPGVHFNPKNLSSFRNDFNNVVNFIESKNDMLDQESLLLTNDVHVQLYWIFSDHKYFYYPYIFSTSLKDTMIEVQLINAFKYLELELKDFENFINQNVISSWRVVNTNNYFFLGHLKYQANYLKKFSPINEYPLNTRQFINKKSVYLTNQIILPKDELERLKIKFSELKKNIDLEPNIIILNKYNSLERNILKNLEYCNIFENKNFIIITKKSHSLCIN